MLATPFTACPAIFEKSANPPLAAIFATAGTAAVDGRAAVCSAAAGGGASNASSPARDSDRAVSTMPAVKPAISSAHERKNLRSMAGPQRYMLRFQGYTS